MKILVDVEHPAHVHFFKNMIWKLEEKGHEVKVVARATDTTLNLLNAYKFKYKNLGKHQRNLFNKIVELIIRDYKLYKIAKEFQPDILTSVGSESMAHVSRLIRKPHIAFEDTEHAKLTIWLTNPFSDVICTPSCFKRDLGKKQVRYNGYHELAYLHPNYFKPDLTVLEDLGLSKDDKFIIIRFVSWSAVHDIGQYGISSRKDLVSKLEKYGQVFISSEGKIEKELEKYKLKVSPEKFHSLLYYAQLYIGEGGSTATEAAILGTPSIHVSSTAKYCGNFEDLHKNYKLIYTFSDDRQALEKAIEILEDPDSKRKWRRRREKMLKEKIDVTAFMTDFIENFPESFYELREKEFEDKCSQEF